MSRLLECFAKMSEEADRLKEEIAAMHITISNQAAKIDRLKEKLNNPTPYCPCPELADKDAEIERLADALEKAIELKENNMIDWISVKDRLPEGRTHNLWLLKSNSKAYTGTVKNNGVVLTPQDGCWRTFSEFTHWAEINLPDREGE